MATYRAVVNAQLRECDDELAFLEMSTVHYRSSLSFAEEALSFKTIEANGLLTRVGELTIDLAKQHAWVIIGKGFVLVCSAILVGYVVYQVYR